MNERENKYLKPEDAATYLGISRKTLHTYTRQGRLHVYILSARKHRYAVEELDEFMQSCKSKI